METELPVTVHTLVVEDVTVTLRPDVEVGLTPNAATPYVTSPG